MCAERGTESQECVSTCGGMVCKDRPTELGCGTLAGWSETERGSFTFVGGLAAGEVCADTHPVCRPVPWYQIGKNGDGFSPVGARLFGCLRCGVCCIDAGIGPVELGGKSGSRLLRLFFFLGSVFCP